MYNQPKAYSLNYDFSQAISKCNTRLERLKAEKNYINNTRINILPSLIFPYNYYPQRRPVYPNPIIYSHQFIPPKQKDTVKEPIKTTPVPQQRLVFGKAMHQERPDKNGFTGNEFRMFIAGCNYMEEDPKHATFLKEVVDYNTYLNNIYKPAYE